jgi:DNA-binding SARP family transcriptional activator
MTDTATGDVGEPGPPATQQRAFLRVLGNPEILNITADGRPLRAKAAELAVFLACHPGGADARTIGEHLEADSRLRQADQHVHNNVSNLRHVLGRAAGLRRNAHVTKTGGRYRLDPATVDVDLWQLHDQLTRAASATDPSTREQCLRTACDLYTGPLAASHAYDWIEPHREQTRQDAVQAHRQLAEHLIETNPRQAAGILDRAITIDRYNEDLYRCAMTVQHRLGDLAAIRRVHRTLVGALAELDAEPEQATEVLVEQLLAESV